MRITITTNANGVYRFDERVVESEDDAIEEMLKVYQERFDHNFFPREDGREVCDCDGDIIWSCGDTKIGTCDVYASFDIEEE